MKKIVMIFRLITIDQLIAFLFGCVFAMCLAGLMMSCNQKKDQAAHVPKWHWLYIGQRGGVCIDTSLCDDSMRIADTFFVTRKSDGGIVFKYIYQKPDSTNGYNFEDNVMY